MKKSHICDVCMAKVRIFSLVKTEKGDYNNAIPNDMTAKAEHDDRREGYADIPASEK